MNLRTLYWLTGTGGLRSASSAGAVAGAVAGDGCRAFAAIWLPAASAWLDGSGHRQPAVMCASAVSELGHSVAFKDVLTPLSI